MAFISENVGDGPYTENVQTSDRQIKEFLSENESVFMICCDFINYRLLKENFEWHSKPSFNYNEPNDICQSMRRLGELMEKKFHDVVGESITVMLKTTSGTAHDYFTSACDGIFREQITWGRIIAAFSMAGAFAVYCVQILSMPILVDCLSDWLASYIEGHLLDWIKENGGWQKLVFLEHFI